MVSLIRRGKLSPVELLEAHLRQIGEANPGLNAFTAVRTEDAREEARRSERALRDGVETGPLHGVPITVKDSFDVAGMPTQTGSRLRPDRPALDDAVAVARLRNAGAIVIGKTNTPEMLANFETDNLLTGRTNNPWNPERTPGGSSGGEAAAIASFCSAGGLGSDGGGSIRVPAHFCGIAGLKPTPGRVPGGGHTPVLGYPTGLLTVAGPMARNARDLELLFRVLAAYDETDPFSVPAPWRESAARATQIGVWEQFYQVPAAPEVRMAVRQAGAWLGDHGHAVDAFEPGGLERTPNVWAFLFQWPLTLVRKLAEGHEEELHWTLREALDVQEPTSEQVMLTLASRDRLRASFLRQLGGRAAVILPVCGIPAFAHRQRKFRAGDREIGLFQAVIPAVLANVLGLPAVTVPVALSSEGLPIGVQLMGHPFDDELLLALAAQLEESRGAWGGVPVPRLS